MPEPVEAAAAGTAARMDLRQALLVHQVHPVKLAADISASLVSLPLPWRGHRRAAMAIHYGLPVLAPPSC